MSRVTNHDQAIAEGREPRGGGRGHSRIENETKFMPVHDFPAESHRPTPIASASRSPVIPPAKRRKFGPSVEGSIESIDNLVENNQVRRLSLQNQRDNTEINTSQYSSYRNSSTVDQHNGVPPNESPHGANNSTPNTCFVSDSDEMDMETSTTGRLNSYAKSHTSYEDLEMLEMSYSTTDPATTADSINSLDHPATVDRHKRPGTQITWNNGPSGAIVGRDHACCEQPLSGRIH